MDGQKKNKRSIKERRRTKEKNVPPAGIKGQPRKEMGKKRIENVKKDREEEEVDNDKDEER